MKRFIFVLIGIFLSYGSVSFGHGEETHSQTKINKPTKPAKHEHKAWMFSVGLGASYSQPLTSPPSNSSKGDHENLSLDEGHNHGGDGDSGNDSSSSSSIFAFASVSYMVTHSLSLSLTAGYDFTNSDLNDPALGFFNTKPLTRRWSLGYGASLSAPLSRSSQKTYKITTLSLTAGPKYRWTKSFSTGLAAVTSFSWYSKTVITDEEESYHSAPSSMLDGETHDDHEAEHASGEDTGNREFSRYGARASATYKISQIRFDSNVGIFLIQKQFGSPYWSLESTILMASYDF